MQKARKLAGGAATKKKFEIEEHYDDCGTDLSGLGPVAVLLASDYAVELAEEDDSYHDHWA